MSLCTFTIRHEMCAVHSTRIYFALFCYCPFHEYWCRKLYQKKELCKNFAQAADK